MQFEEDTYIPISFRTSWVYEV